MLSKISMVLSLIDSKSRTLIIVFAILRILISALDIIGIIVIGLLLARSAENITGQRPSINFNNWVHSANELSLPTLAIISLLTFLGKSALAIFFLKVMANTLAGAETNLAKKVFERFFYLSRDEISKISKSELSFALTFSATYGVTNLLTMFIIVISESTLLFAVIALFTFVNSQISLGIIIYFAVVGLIIYKVLGSKMYSAGKLYAYTATNSTEISEDSLDAIREILTLRKENEFVDKFEKYRKGLSKASADVTFYSSLPRYIIESALMVGAIGLAGYIFTFSDSTTAAGLLGIFLTGGLRITASIIPLQSALAAMKQLSAQAQSFFDLVKKVDFEGKEIDDISTVNKSNSIVSPIEVELKNVSFVYPSSDLEVVKNISLKINSGEYVAIIGPSGAGKSTIADLLIGFTEPTKGEVNYVNVPRESASLGYVPQSPGIVHGSILDNITLSINSQEYDSERLRIALSNAHLTGLIDSLEDGINTKLGAQADSLSGGQIQRIGLARALYASPGLLVLDEATSALDPETESAFSKTLNKLKGKCSIVVIAHRLSTVKDADCVYVVDQGQIVASGKFNELVKSNDLVARYVELSDLTTK